MLKKLSWLIDVLLIALILTGVIFRFGWTNWSYDASLHPDEYGLTNTLTQLHLPKTLGEYFNTRLSPLSPYQKYDLAGNPTVAGPDNRMRWGQFPIILLRWAGEVTKNTGYNEIRLVGRRFSALVDSLSLVMIFMTGSRLYGRRVGLLAAAFSSLAVMQIQQSHFMTADTFAVLFTCTAMYCAVRAAQSLGLKRPELIQPEGTGLPVSAGSVESAEKFNLKFIFKQLKIAPRPSDYRPAQNAWVWYALFGVFSGMVVASRINLLPLCGMILIAAFISIADLKLKNRRDLRRIALFTLLYLALAGICAVVTFRITQPMTFRAPSGNTTLFTLTPNPDWVESMGVASSESSGIGGGPPSEQWAHRLPILFPLMNMVVWGMGLPLGILAWAGFLWAAWRLVRHGENWRAHLLPLIWSGGYFLFMGTRFVKSIRYFLPIYPFLCLLGAWALAALWRRFIPASSRPKAALFKLVVPLLVSLVVLLGTLAWASGFVGAVYLTPHTRILASRWILHNIPAPFQVVVNTSGGTYQEPISAPEKVQMSQQSAYTQPFTLAEGGKLAEVIIPKALLITPGKAEARLRVVIASDTFGRNILDETEISIQAVELAGGEFYHGTFTGAILEKEIPYYLIASVITEGVVQVKRLVVSNENWDEGLPVPMEGRDPFGQYYQGTTMEVRWYDDENKRQMFLENLANVDYIILPSQRGIWSVCRIPLTYPMTMEYYRALFDGRLGFELVAEFDSPFQFGALSISDVGGTAAWGRKAPLPLFNTNFFAAEEAFSVYDHPPVWIFKKRADFNLEVAKAILEAVDLTKVVIQSPRDATWITP